MENYKPAYMGKVMPVNDTAKLTDFVVNKYEAFSKCYDSCKDQSANITDVKAVETEIGKPDFGIKISADSKTLTQLNETANKLDSVSMNGDVIMANKK